MYIEVEENIRIEFDRFYTSAKFNNIELPEVLRDLLEILESNIICEYEGQTLQIEEEAYEEGFDQGRDHGYEEAYEEGFDEGKDQGYELGHSDGKEVGHDEGYSEGLEQGHEDGHELSYEEGFQDGYDQAIADEDNDRA